MRRLFLTICAAAICACCQLHEPRRSSGAPPTQDAAPTIEAGPLETEHEITVLLFVATDCPISNRYAPVIRQLVGTLPSDRVAFWLVYADPETTAYDMHRHQEAFELPFAAVLDRTHRLVRLAGATTVPEAAVFAGLGSERRLVYRGRIDDRFPALGVMRAEPTHQDLKCVLESLVDGRETAISFQPAVGCPIPNLAQFK